MCAEVALACRPRYHLAAGDPRGGVELGGSPRPGTRLAAPGAWAAALRELQLLCKQWGANPVLHRRPRALRPPVLCCAGKRAFYARAPYLNKDLGAGGHVTRFIGLAEVRGA